jgi:uncharacterized protein (TIGR00645 family)
MAKPPDPSHPGPSLAERSLEQMIFSSRWLLAPVFAGLAVGLLVLLIKFARAAADLLLGVLSLSVQETIVGVLGLIDLALMGSLVVMVMFAGYENFVSKLDISNDHDRPDWMGHVDFSDLKLKLMASIVAISAIQLLEKYMNVSHVSDRDLGWSLGIHLTFVVASLLLALMDRLSAPKV